VYRFVAGTGADVVGEGLEIYRVDGIHMSTKSFTATHTPHVEHLRRLVHGACHEEVTYRTGETQMTAGSQREAAHENDWAEKCNQGDSSTDLGSTTVSSDRPKVSQNADPLFTPFFCDTYPDRGMRSSIRLVSGPAACGSTILSPCPKSERS